MIKQITIIIMLILCSTTIYADEKTIQELIPEFKYKYQDMNKSNHIITYEMKEYNVVYPAIAPQNSLGPLAFLVFLLI